MQQGKKYIGKKSKPLDNSYHLINFSPWSFLSLDNFFPLITFITWSFLSLDNFYHLITSSSSSSSSVSSIARETSFKSSIVIITHQSDSLSHSVTSITSRASGDAKNVTYRRLPHQWTELWSCLFTFWNSQTRQVSCSALCDKNEATICPSRMCSACASDAQVENGTIDKTGGGARDGRSIYTLSGSDLQYCTNARHNCKFRKYPECCANTFCKQRKPNNYNKNCLNRYFEGWFGKPEQSLIISCRKKLPMAPNARARSVDL